MSPEEILARFALADDAAARMATYIRAQRWFGGRGRAIREATIDDAGVLRETEPAVVFALVRLDYEDGTAERYHLPVGVLRGGVEALNDPHRLIAEGDRDGEPVSVYDALSDARCAAVYWELMAAGRRVATSRGELRATARNHLQIGDDLVAGIHHLAREQSNTSLIRDDTDLLKCFRQVEDGLTPELEMSEALNAAGFDDVPKPLGTIEYLREGAEPTLVALLQPYLRNVTEGWTLALTSLRDLYADAEIEGTDDRADIARAIDEQGSTFLPEAQRLGEVTAEMHLALASNRVPESMRAEPIGADTIGRWADTMNEDLDRLLATGAPVLAPLAQRRAQVAATFDRIRRIGDGGLAIRFHGDYHLGQVLRTDSGWMILDFEGEPARSLAERRQRSSALRDVAGMLRSFDYAAAAALAERTRATEQPPSRLVAYGDAWASANGRLFWGAYLARAGHSRLLPPDAADTVALRRAFEVQKAVYEVGYELGHRPDWVGIPLRFLLREVAA